MPGESIVFAGLELTSGRKPVTFIALDDELNIRSPERWDIPETLVCLEEYKNIWLAVTMASPARAVDEQLRQKILQAGFAVYPGKRDSRQLLITSAQGCFQALIGQKPLPRRTLEGRLQRTAILYGQGLQLTDPVDVFEEITRFKLTQGILPLEKIYSPRELDALVAAYLAWLAANQPGRVDSKGEFVLPAPE